MARQRAAAQLLGRREALAVEDVVRRLLAVQSQDARAASLALRARSEGLRASDVEAALGERRTLVVTWLLRGTLHLVAREDVGWLLALTAPARMTANRRRLGQEGVTPDAAERAVGLIEDALAADGPLDRAALGERLAARGIPTAGQALPHLLHLAALRGLVVRTAGAAFALTRDWLGEPFAPVDRDAALRELGRRYLAAHAPATPEDLAKWTGLPLRDARAALRDALDPPPPPDLNPIPPRLLPAFDPYLLGWRDRSFAVPAALTRAVHPGGGILRATATVDGIVTGTWSRTALDAPDPDLFTAELADVTRFEARK